PLPATLETDARLRGQLAARAPVADVACPVGITRRASVARKLAATGAALENLEAFAVGRAAAPPPRPFAPVPPPTHPRPPRAPARGGARRPPRPPPPPLAFWSKIRCCDKLWCPCDLAPPSSFCALSPRPAATRRRVAAARPFRSPAPARPDPCPAPPPPSRA